MEKYEEYTAADVAKWFLSKKPMSPKKLQKMLYYAYAWTLTLTNDDINDLSNRLFPNRFEAWVHGPVLPDIYQEYKPYGFHDIDESTANDLVQFPTTIENILEQVWSVYGNYSADQLESITHQERHWQKARGNCNPIEYCNAQISDQDIYECYIARVA
jgi:uncharacterized phage-associated protein|nr:MAG TPA: hypothetical protein [Caudoviricetes sp.]